MHTFVRIISANEKSPAGKLADAELHFTGDDLDGLKLLGFAIWAGNHAAEEQEYRRSAIKDVGLDRVLRTNESQNTRPERPL
jgi:hypothetical protein